MKILEINKYFYIKGGAEKHFFDLLDLLAGAGNEVAVFSMEHEKNFPSKWSNFFLSKVGFDEGCNIWLKIKGGFRDLYSFEAKRKINKILDEFKPEIVHIHNIYHQLSPMILFEIKKRNIPIVMTVHDYKLVNPNYNLFHQGKFYDRCLNGKYYQCFLDKCFKDSYFKSFLAMLEMYWHDFLGSYRKNIDEFIVPSEFAKNILIERGIPKRKIKVIPHFIAQSKEDSLEKNENQGEKYALFFGRIAKGKGVEDLADIFKDGEGLKLYLAGNTEDKSLVYESERIKYLGFLGKDLLKGYIKKAQFVISPSKLPETFGLVALESIREGVPFVGYNSGAYREIISHGVNGYLAKNREELRKVVDNFEQLNNFDKGKIKKEALAKYAAEDYYNKLMQVFKNLI